VMAAYQRKSNIAALVFVGCIVGAVVMIDQSNENLWDGGIIGAATGIGTMASWFYALWAYMKAKGRSGLWCLLGMGSVLGLVVLLLLKDRHRARAAASVTA
jgi:hypothetical protein